MKHLLRSWRKKVRNPRQQLFYGWYVTGCLFFANFLTMGLRQGFGIFVESWQDTFGVGVAIIAIAASIGSLVNGSSQILLGWLVDRIGCRIVVTASAVLFGISAMLMSTANSVIMLIAIYGVLMSFSSAGLSGAPTAAAIVRWFQAERGTAMSVLTSGGSLGGLVLVPFLTYLFLWTDWRSAWLIAGALVLVLGAPLFYLVLRDDPSQLGLHPDGNVRQNAASISSIAIGPLTTRRWFHAFRSAPMWQLSIAYWVCGVTTVSISVHYMRWAASEGVSPATAALAFGLLSALNAIGVLIAGPLSDRMPRKNLLAIVYFVRGIAFLLLVLLSGRVAVWVFAIVGGVSWLATVPLTTSLAADIYGTRHLGAVAGAINLMHQIGGALSVLLFGLMFDIHDSYDWAFVASFVVLIIASLISITIREQRYSCRYTLVANPIKKFS